MGHASITITLDRYGQLFPGSEERLPSSSTRTLNAMQGNRASRGSRCGETAGKSCPRGAVFGGSSG